MPLRVSSYNLGCLQDNAFDSDAKRNKFQSKLETEVEKLAEKNDVLCFQEVNTNWRSVILRSLKVGPASATSRGGVGDLWELVPSGALEYGLCEFYNASRVSLRKAALVQPFTVGSLSKTCRRVSVMSVEEVETKEICALMNLHCHAGQGLHKIPGSAEKAKKFKQNFLTNSLKELKAFAQSQGCGARMVVGDTNLTSIDPEAMKLPKETTWAGQVRDFAVATKGGIDEAQYRFTAWDNMHKTLEVVLHATPINLGSAAQPTAAAASRSLPPAGGWIGAAARGARDPAAEPADASRPPRMPRVLRLVNAPSRSPSAGHSRPPPPTREVPRAEGPADIDKDAEMLLDELVEMQSVVVPKAVAEKEAEGAIPPDQKRQRTHQTLRRWRLLRI